MCIRSRGIVMLVRVLRGGNAQQTQFRGAVLVSRIFRMSSLLTDARDSCAYARGESRASSCGQRTHESALDISHPRSHIRV